ncbi:MAG TPA: SDR family oxidoreductase [Gemmatimonadaceae bacterium]|nr:SDR family oxidoreductase [Gemmatimonadaceae bacterium]
MTSPTYFLTGATGHVGGAVLARLLRDPQASVFVLVRDHARWRLVAERAGAAAVRITPVPGDLTSERLGADERTRRALRARGCRVIHLAADTCFSRSLPLARLVNTEGTRNALAFARDIEARRVAHVSTAFVAGCRTGPIADDSFDDAGWVNGYERSKYEAEVLVRTQATPWTILRPSMIVCDDAYGRITAINAVHRSLRLLHAGLASMLPGDERNGIDVVTADWVADSISRLTDEPAAEGRTLHLCAGRHALPLGELLDRTYDVWSRDPAWHRRAVSRPALTDLETYRLFERSVEESADPRLQRVVRSLSHFIAQLALPKVFDTTGVEALLGAGAPKPASYWDAMVERLLAHGFAAPARAAA